MKAKSLLLPVVALALGGLSGCGKKQETRSATDNTLAICVYDGGYGTEWIDQVAKDYTAKTGVKVIWDADQSILDRLTSDLKNPSYDIYMSHDITWQSFAAQGLLEELDDLYQRDVEVEYKGTKTTKKFVERLSPGSAEVSKFNEHYYKVNYTLGAGGLVYNVDMFREHGWQIPKTYDELMTLCQTIVDAEVSAGGLDTVVPIAWSADREYYWDYMVFEWWAQLGGEADINKYKAFLGDDGKYSTGYEVYNPDTNHKNFKKAYELWKNFVANSSHTSYFNDTPQSTKLVTANTLFASKKAAMIPYAQWAKWEIQNNTHITFDFDIAMMKTPRVDSTITKDYNYNVGFGDSIIVPKNDAEENKQRAKDFITYLSSPEACKTFVDKARGAFLAFDYSCVDLGDLLNDTYVKSIYEKLTDCTQFNLVSTNPVAYVNSAAIMPWIGNTYYYSKAFAAPNDDKYTPTTVCNNIYTTAKNSWESWVKKAGVKD